MGFTSAKAGKLFSQEKHREELVRYYAMVNLIGTFHTPEIVSTLMKNLRLKHYIKRDGLVIGLSGLARISVSGAKYALTGKELGYFQLLSYKTMNKVFIYNAEKYCCDGDEEEINAQRKWYLNALNVLNCLPDTTLDNVRRSYYRLAQANHPDKCPDKEAATAKFQSIVVAFEIVKSYHEVLNVSCEILNMKLKDVNVNVLEQWKAKNTQTMQNNEKINRAYYVVYRQVAYTSDEWKGLRAWLDGDQKLSLQKPMLAIPFST
ncbi:unnamed protein product [Rotaria magnacalcarata]|uniref:J domain-containing protein n=1 Tax=Rotaria magnacalcarata TaxID=392030 RepID=A0A816TZB8_9BILA|nr:unnamed protein product [Rotaria magnacalcarata]CAF2105722.1 unnamed protein product [Rotaria magnacalcarata]